MSYVCALCNTYINQQKLRKHITETHKMDFNTYLRYHHFGREISCINCKKPVRISPRNHSKYCSNHCQLQYQYKNETEGQKLLRKRRISQGWTDESKEKQSKTKRKFYRERANSNYFIETSDKNKQTKLLRYGNENYNNSDQYKRTCLLKYGVDNIRKLPGYYSKYLSNRVSKIKAKCKKQGANWTTNLPGVLNKILKSQRKTNQDKYEVDFPLQNKEIRNKTYETLINRTADNWRSTAIKKSKNLLSKGIKVGHSTEEEIIGNCLKNMYSEVYTFESIPDYIFSRVKDKYPFNFDFYIPSIDLIVEYQGFFTHGYEPYKNTEDQKNLLETWKIRAKTSKLYDNAVRVWTEQDVLKEKVANRNKIKLLRIYPRLLITKIKLENIDELTEEIQNIIDEAITSYNKL